MRILVIEDEERIANFVSRGLSEEGFAVDIAVDGEAGLEKATAGAYDLLVLDLMLPKLSGLELLRKLRTAGNQIPVLVLTARDGVEFKVEGLNAGADDYLTKPFSFDEFLARIRALMRRGPVSADVDLKIGDLALNLVTRTATRNSRKIELSSREFMLLEYFMRNPGAVLSRTRIYQHVWDYNFDGMTNVVDVYVNYLRKKIEQEGEAKLLHTVRGHGYVLKAPE
ncbi:MAG TPA: response regulator transcription factor [Planctomycetota bacterium]|nr:response regulator transcription factor [Planctomycetota bacterium]